MVGFDFSQVKFGPPAGNQSSLALATPASAPPSLFFTPQTSRPDTSTDSASKDAQWLDTLPTLSLFSLPGPSLSSPSKAGVDELSLPPSPEPEAPAILPSGRKAIASVIDSEDDDGQASAGKVRGVDVGRHQVFALVNDTDLILAAPPTTPRGPSELRILPLAKHKAREAHQHRVLRPQFHSRHPTAKTALRQRGASLPPLTADHGLPNEPFVKLVPNPAGRLLAVVGRFEVGVIVLPRRNWYESRRNDPTTPTRPSPSSSAAASSIDVESYPIGRPHHHKASRTGDAASSPITDVLWHPYGASSQTLLVLTFDGLVREYDLGTDVAEPSQTINLDSEDPMRYARPSPLDEQRKKSAQPPKRGKSIGLSSHRLSTPTRKGLLRQQQRESSATSTQRSTTARRSFGLRAVSTPPRSGGKEEEGSTGAGMVAICLGEGKGDWASLTLYGLTREGDVVAVCPYLPVACEMPASVARSLAYFVSDKLEESSTGGSLGDLPVHIRPNLIRSLEYVKALTAQLSDAPRHRTPAPLADSDDEEPAAEVADGEEGDEEDIVQISPPARMIGRPRRQGPFLMQPPPREISEDEAVACDFRFISHRSPRPHHDGDGAGDALRTSLGIFVVAYQDRIDVCLEVDRPEPVWHSASLLLPPDSAEALEMRALEAPSLLVYESIDIGLTGSLSSAPDSATSLILDGVYAGTVYAYHSFGAHALMMDKWLDPLADLVDSTVTRASDGIPQARLVTLPRTEVFPLLDTPKAPVEGLVVIKDAYLGYSLLATTDKLQTVGIELELRPATLDSPSAGASTPASGSTRRPLLEDKPRLYKTLMAAKPLDFEKETALKLGSSDVHLPPLPPALAGKSAGATTEALKATWTMTSDLGKKMRLVVESANIVQDRHRLQLDEHGRQVSELARLRTELARSGSKTKELEERAGEVGKRQKALVDRADGVLQALMNKATPELSRHEQDWFKELGQVRGQIKDGSETPGGSFDDRLQKIKERLQQMTPDLKTLADRRTPRHTPSRTGASPATPSRLGTSQIQTIEGKLAEETKLLEHATAKVNRLSKMLSD